jgi:hypothetical protein
MMGRWSQLGCKLPEEERLVNFRRISHKKQNSEVKGGYKKWWAIEAKECHLLLAHSLLAPVQLLALSSESKESNFWADGLRQYKGSC